MTELPRTISDAAAALRRGDTTSVALTSAMLAQADTVDPALGVYLHRGDEAALAAARRADAELAEGYDRGPLHGIPLGIKDIIATKDAPTTAQSLVLDPSWGENVDAPVTQRLREAGAVLTGKTTTMEFACGNPDPEKPFPVPKNPWNVERWTGGSSSGTASGVATGLFYGGLGTDTGGSIRIPSAYCGITGIKPTFGLVPKSGCTPVGYSLDHIGPMARSARDCALMLEVLAGHDSSDLTSAEVEIPAYTDALTGSLEGLRIGVDRIHHLHHPNNDPALAEVFEAALVVLEEAGATLVEVELPEFEAALAGMNLTSRVEALSYHMLDMRHRRELFGKYTAHMLELGGAVMGFEYVQAQRARTVIRRKVSELFSNLDAVVSPTSGAGALPLEGLTSESSFFAPNFTRYWNLIGYPALAAPMGFTGDGLPLSLQVAAAPFQDAMALRIGDAYQQLTEWHLRVPSLATEVLV